MWETGAILRYLANRYGTESFWPADLLKRTNVDRWAEWSKINVAMAFTAPVFWRVVRTAQEKRDENAIRGAMATLEQNLLFAERQLEKHSYLAGDDFSLADVQFGHVLYRYYSIDVVRQPLAKLRSYYDRLAARAAFREHVMVSYEELRV